MVLRDTQGVVLTSHQDSANHKFVLIVLTPNHGLSHRHPARYRLRVTACGVREQRALEFRWRESSQHTGGFSADSRTPGEAAREPCRPVDTVSDWRIVLSDIRSERPRRHRRHHRPGRRLPVQFLHQPKMELYRSGFDDARSQRASAGATDASRTQSVRRQDQFRPGRRVVALIPARPVFHRER